MLRISEIPRACPSKLVRGRGEWVGRRGLTLGARLLRQFNATQVVSVLVDSAQKRFGYLLSVVGFLEQVLVGGIRQKGNFGKDGRHVCPDEDDRSEEHTSELQSPMY